MAQQALQLTGPVHVSFRQYSNIERMVIERVNRPTASRQTARTREPDGANYIIMYINPQRISIRQRKVIQRVQTNTRWVFQHWGAEPVAITYNGLTGYMKTGIALAYGQRYLPNQLDDYIDGKTGKRLLSPYETPAYQALLKLRTFYEEPHKSLQGTDLTKISGSETDANLQKLRLNLYYRDTMYVGYFTRMEIREEENSPWMWNYSMEFTAFETEPNKYAGQLHTLEAGALTKAALSAGIAVDAHYGRAANTARTAPSIRGVVSPALSRSGVAASVTESYKLDRTKLSENIINNLLQRNLDTIQSTDSE